MAVRIRSYKEGACFVASDLNEAVDAYRERVKAPDNWTAIRRKATYMY